MDKIIEQGYNNIMIDIEALGTTRDCVVVSVGAVRFNLNTGSIYKTMYWELKLMEQGKAGRVISPETVQWWSQQSPEVLEALHRPDKARYPVKNFIASFSQFIEGNNYYWAKGTNYDLEILTNLYAQYGEPPPFRYSRWVDARVFYLLNDKLRLVPKVQREGAHNALSDALFQTNMVCELYKHLKFNCIAGKRFKKMMQSLGDDVK